jgi:hypothetical protein
MVILLVDLALWWSLILKMKKRFVFQHGLRDGAISIAA